MKKSHYKSYILNSMLDALGSWTAFIAYTLELPWGKITLVSNGQVIHNVFHFCKINLAWLNYKLVLSKFILFEDSSLLYFSPFFKSALFTLCQVQIENGLFFLLDVPFHAMLESSQLLCWCFSPN